MNLKLRNKVKGAVYGFAIGDAMGATTEFMTADQIRKKYGRVTSILGGGWLGLEPGEVTDDTQMTMCVMDAIMKMPKDHNQFKKVCEQNFIRWFDSKPKDVGGQCARAITLLKHGKNIPVDDTALGNGSLMRAMPLAIMDLPFLNIFQGSITHNNLTCSNIIIEYTELLQAYMKDNHIKAHNVIKHYAEPVNEFVTRFRACEPTGHVYNTFKNSIIWSLNSNVCSAITAAVNHGGDADTIAAITGSLAGAKHGFENIPEEWVNDLNPETKEFLEKFINFVFAYLQI